MVNPNNEAGKESSSWRGEDRRYICQADPLRKGGVKVSSSVDGPISSGVPRTDWEGQNSNFGRIITGGILSQLIEVVAEQLAEAEDCIEWYQNRAEGLRNRLEELEELKQLNDKDPSDSDN